MCRRDTITEMDRSIPPGVINLAEAELGAEALWASDDFFAPRERMLARAEPVSRPGVFDDNGQWMDGWESRRRRGAGHDACIVKLALPGLIQQVDLDTRYFTGNYPPHASIEATNDPQPRSDTARWQTLLPKSALTGNSHNLFTIENGEPWQVLRLNIFPDGGIARLRVWGRVRPDWSRLGPEEVIDLFALRHGGVGLIANDEHYGSIRNLNRPGRGVNMGDGWETRRRREPGSDWAILELGHRGTIEEIEVDTAHFRGNFPDRVSLQAALLDEPASISSLAAASERWMTLLSEQKMRADSPHRFREEVAQLGPVSHVRLNLHPDGGVSRLRLYGRIAR
jgi:allantoicase